MTETQPIAWDYDIPLLNNRFIWWDLLKTAGIASVSMWVLVAGMGWLIEGEAVLLPLFVVPFAFVVLIVLFAFACLLLGNRSGVRFEVSSAGVAWQSGARESKVSTLVTVVGALAGSASTTGAGLLAKSSEAGIIEWSDVGRLRVHPGPRVVSVMNGWRVVVRLYCQPELFDAVVAVCEAGFASAHAARMAEQAATAAAATAPAQSRSLLSRVGWGVLCLALTAAMFAWYWMEPQTEVASRIALIGGVLVALAAALEGPARVLLGALGAIGVVAQIWALAISALDPFSSSSISPALGVVEVKKLSATLDTPALVVASAATVALLAIAMWRMFGRTR